MSKTKNAPSILSFVDTETLRANVEEVSLEDMYLEALRNRGGSGSVTETRAARDRRMTILQQLGFDIKHVDDFEPHPANFFSLDQEEIDNLAATIRETKRTRPITYRTRPNGQKDQIIGGERRWRAHKRNWELTGDEFWAMIPCENLGMLDDEEAMFHLVSDNLANRILTASELAKSVDIAGERIAEQRRTDPDYARMYEGRKTREIVADMFRISPVAVTRLQNINRNLSDEGKRLLDKDKITKEQALDISKLSNEQQDEITEKVVSGEANKQTLSWYISKIKENGSLANIQSEASKPKKEKTVNELLENAEKTLKRATKLKGEPSKVMIAQMKVYLMELEEKLESTNPEA